MRRKYTEEEKYQFFERYYGGETVSEICLSSGIAKSTLYIWLKPYRINRIIAGCVVSDTEFMGKKKRLEKLEQVVEILKNVNCTALSTRKKSQTC